MKKIFIISLLSVACSCFSQEQAPVLISSDSDTIVSGGEVKTLQNIPKSDFNVSPLNDSTVKRVYWRISETTGEILPGNPDTTMLNYPSRTYIDGQSVSMSYLGNLGLPGRSRIFSEIGETSNFMFADGYRMYKKTPSNFNFINTKVPFSNVTYHTAGGGDTQEERFLGSISSNFGKKLNVGLDFDIVYTKGFYQSQGSKHLDITFYSSYFSDRYRYHLFFNSADYTNYENGGITNDLYITDPTDPEVASTGQSIKSKEIPVYLMDTWNRVYGARFYYTHRYNLGFEKETDKTDEDGEKIKQFVPVSSIIHTLDFYDQSHKFISRDGKGIDSLYVHHYNMGDTVGADDKTSEWYIKNTLGISLREGFSSWSKFDLTAYATLDYRNYTLQDSIVAPDTISKPWKQTQTVVYVGGEMTRNMGKILRYSAAGELGVLGDNLGDFKLTGTIETRLPVFKDTASLKATAYIKNTEPSFYQQHNKSRYFFWDNDFDKIKRVYLGGELNIPHTRTNISMGVENLTNYVYFDENALPAQYSGSIQVLSARLNQDFKYRGFGWNNEIVYQKSGKEDVVPLPELSIYSNLYVFFKIAKVLSVQIGANVYYFTKYYSPAYEPATQQFHVQRDVEIGDYPLVNAYINCHLKNTRFFVSFYNISSKFVNDPAYFSLPHYPLNPMVIKFGLSWNFNN